VRACAQQTLNGFEFAWDANLSYCFRV
jgi:hypothetical protein